MSNETVLQFKGGCGEHEHTRIEALKKEELVWVVDKWLQVSNNKMLFETVIPQRN